MGISLAFIYPLGGGGGVPLTEKAVQLMPAVGMNALSRGGEERKKLEAASTRMQRFFVFPENTGTAIRTSVTTPSVRARKHTRAQTHAHAYTVGEGASLCSPAVLSDCSVCWATAAVIPRPQLPPCNPPSPRPPSPLLLAHAGLNINAQCLHTHTHTLSHTHTHAVYAAQR